MYEYKVEGGIPIRGTIAASGNKNAALPCIAATLLTEEPVILRNIPEIEDTGVMLLILQALGAGVEKIGDHEWKIDACGTLYLSVKGNDGVGNGSKELLKK